MAQICVARPLQVEHSIEPESASRLQHIAAMPAVLSPMQTASAARVQKQKEAELAKRTAKQKRAETERLEAKKAAAVSLLQCAARRWRARRALAELRFASRTADVIMAENDERWLG